MEFDRTPPCQCVVIRRNGNDGNKVNLDFESVSIFGSEVDCDVRIRQDSVLPKHASVHVDYHGRVFVSSVDAENPATLNNQPISKGAYVHNNDVMIIGDKSFRFEYLKTILSPISTNIPHATSRKGAPKSPSRKCPSTPNKSPSRSRPSTPNKSPSRNRPLTPSKIPACPTPPRVGDLDVAANTAATAQIVFENPAAVDLCKVDFVSTDPVCPSTPPRMQSPARPNTPKTRPVEATGRESTCVQSHSPAVLVEGSHDTGVCPATPSPEGKESQSLPSTPRQKSPARISTPQTAPVARGDRSSLSRSQLSRRRSGPADQSGNEEHEAAVCPATPERMNSSTSSNVQSAPAKTSASRPTRGAETPKRLSWVSVPDSLKKDTGTNDYPMTDDDKETTKQRSLSPFASRTFTPNLKSTPNTSERHPTPMPGDHTGRSLLSSISTCSSSLLTSIQEENGEGFYPSPMPTPNLALFQESRRASAIVKDNAAKRKSVTFGPQLSPEYFDKRLPAKTPIKRGRMPAGGSLDQCPTTFVSAAPLPVFPDMAEEEESEQERSSLQDSSVMTEDSSVMTEDSSVMTGDSSVMTGDSSVMTGDSSVMTGDSSVMTGDSSVMTGDSSVMTEDSSSSDDDDDDVDSGGDLSTIAQCSSPVSDLSLTGADLSCCSVGEQSVCFVGEASFEEPKPKKRALPTPVRKGIKAKGTLKKVLKKSLTTPVREDIRRQPKLRSLRSSRPRMNTPLRLAIHDKPRLRLTKMSLQNLLKDPATLHKTKQSMPIPLRTAIQAAPTLRKTGQKMATPLRNAIQVAAGLRKTKKGLSTPLRKEITNPPRLRKTKNTMPTPVRKEIQNHKPLRKTKQSLPTPIKKDLQNPPALRKTKQSMPTPLRTAIETAPALNKTRQTMATPLRTAIQTAPTLRKTREKMATPLRTAIQTAPTLRKTREKMATPLRTAIQTAPTLRKTREKMATPLRTAIQTAPALRKTREKMATPLRTAIQTAPALRKTRQKMPTPLRTAIQTAPALRKTKKSLPSPLKKQICDPPELLKTMRTMAPTLQQEIQNPPPLRKVTKGNKRKREIDGEQEDDDVRITAAKRRRIAPVRRSAGQPVEDINLTELFRTPRAKPAYDVFDPNLYLSPLAREGRVHFPSPVAKTAKKPNPSEEFIPRPIIKFAPLPISSDFAFTATIVKRNTRSNANNAPPASKTRSVQKGTRSSSRKTGAVVEKPSVAPVAATRSLRGKKSSEAAVVLPEEKPAEVQSSAAPPPPRSTRSRRGKAALDMATSVAAPHTEAATVEEPPVASQSTTSSRRKRNTPDNEDVPCAKKIAPAEQPPKRTTRRAAAATDTSSSCEPVPVPVTRTRGKSKAAVSGDKLEEEPVTVSEPKTTCRASRSKPKPAPELESEEVATRHTRRRAVLPPPMEEEKVDKQPPVVKVEVATRSNRRRAVLPPPVEEEKVDKQPPVVKVEVVAARSNRRRAALPPPVQEEKADKQPAAKKSKKTKDTSSTAAKPIPPQPEVRRSTRLARK